MSKFIDSLCQHLADLQDRYETSTAWPALAAAIEDDPVKEASKGEAEAYYMEWRERHGR